MGAGVLGWVERVLAAALASGSTAMASHRAALVLWGLDGIAAAPVELTVAHTTTARPAGAIVHRSRRLEPACWVNGIPTTSVERTLVESARLVPPVVTEKAFASAWRQHLTTPDKTLLYLEHHGGKGRHGVRRVRTIAAAYAEDGHRPPGSAAEVDLFRVLAPALADAKLPPPVRQFEIALADGSIAVVDAAWPDRGKVVEMEGLRWHGDIRSHDCDVYRETMIRQAGWDLRTVTPLAVRERPTQTVALLLRFLGASA